MASLEERELESRFSGIFRRMWITYTQKNTLQIVVFPIEVHGMYYIFTREKANFRKTEDGIKKIDIDYIEKMVRDEMNKDTFIKTLFKSQSFDLAVNQTMRYAKDRLERYINQVK